MSVAPDHDPLAQLTLREVTPRRELSDSIRRQCTQSLEPRQTWSGPLRVSVALLISSGVVAMTFVMRMDVARLEGWLEAAVWGTLGWAIIQAAVLIVGLGRAPGRRIGMPYRWFIAIGVPLAFMAYLSLAATESVPFHEFLVAHTDSTLRCGLHALLSGAIVSGGVMMLWRHTDPFTPGLSGALAGLFGGLCGAIALGVACPQGQSWHLWLGHGLAVALLTLGGWALGRKWLAP